jgi:site-specific DNA recombinase
MPRRKTTTALKIRELQPGDRIYAHCRDSGGNAQERSVAEQRAEIERYAAAHGLIIAGWYIDEAVASGDYARRSDFQAMLDACRQTPPPVAGVVTYAASRWGRDEYDAAFYRIELRRHNVQVLSITDPVPVGPFMAIIETFQDWKNRTFLDDMSVHVRRGLRANVAAGYAPGGTPPTGYRAEKVVIGHKRDGSPRTVSRWLIDPATGPRVTRAFALAAQGATYGEIHAEVNLLGAKESYVSLFRNRSYLGILKLGAEEFTGHLEPLVDQATWDAVQARIKPRQETARNARRSVSPFLLSGLAHCGHCGHPLECATDRRPSHATTPSHRAYRCRQPACPLGRVNADAVDHAVLAQVLDQVLTPAHIRALLAGVQERLKDPAILAERAATARSIGQTERAVAKLLDALELDGDAATITARLREREKELKQLRQRLGELDQQEQLGAILGQPATVAHILNEMRTQIEGQTVPVARRALQRLLRQVLVWPDRVQIEYATMDLRVLAGIGGMPPRGVLPIPAPWADDTSAHL